MNKIAENILAGINDNRADQNAPSVYIACLASYNEGTLHGVWINIADDDYLDQIQAMLEASPIAGAEEFDIHDYDGFGFNVSSLSLSELHDLAVAIDKHGHLFLDYISRVGFWTDIWTLSKKFEESYLGNYIDEVDYVHQNFIEPQFGNELGWLENHIDYMSIWRSLEMGGDVFSIVGDFNKKPYNPFTKSIHVFSNKS